MTDETNAVAAGGAQLVGTSGRPARPERPPGYWERVDRIVDQAPPLSDTQRAIIRAAFHQPAAIKEAA
ncbi:hypothetical protein ACIBCS_27955 [Streptomyces phaeochromogenes]|uniref:hypothetical protein n=1 Tax=Streptomyces phaeochromogenes TaxID=1923 RepID=UPI0033DE0962